jgi:hypothetical protein
LPTSPCTSTSTRASATGSLSSRESSNVSAGFAIPADKANRIVARLIWPVWPMADG